MKSLFFLMPVVSLAFPFATFQEPKPVGEVLEIGCKAEFKVGVDGKEQQLNRKRDRGRKVFVGERYRCTSKGILKLRVNEQEVNIIADKWFPISEPSSDGSSSPTGGRDGELTWLSGTYTLESVETTASNPAFNEFVANLQGSHLVYFKAAVNAQLDAPKELAFRSHRGRVMFGLGFAPSQTFEIPVDGVLYKSYLSDGTTSALKASGNKRELSIDWYLGDSIRSDVTVEPKNDGETLLITRKLFLTGNPNPFITTLAYKRTPGTIPEELTIKAELLETIETDRPGGFILEVKEPPQHFGSKLNGRFSKVLRTDGKAGFMLIMRMDKVSFQKTSAYPLDALVEKISVKEGPEITFVGNIPGRSNFLGGQVPVLNISGKDSSSTAQLEKDIAIPKRSMFVIKVVLPQH